MIKKAILLVCVPVLVLGLAALADWIPEDGHKMHWPQLPNETGWAVNATQPLILADDFMCMETGWIKDVHFWGAWRHGDEGLVEQFVLSLHADIPADQNPDGYSKPGETLREWVISDWAVLPIDPPTMEGWYDPFNGDVFPEDHYAYFQYNVFLPEADWFPQDSGTIYWLNISAIVQDPVNTQWGWKSTQDNWNDDAVWAEWGDLSWEEMYEPSAPILDGFNIVIDPFGQFVTGGSATAWGTGWYFYPETEWWNIWFYDHPFDSMRTKEMTLIVDVMKMDPGQPSYVEIALNWSTPWYDTIPNDSTPPLPGVPEDSAIGRIILFGGPDLVGHFEEFFVLPDFNPEWVSVDVRGNNFDIVGEIQHECIGSLDLAFVITGGADEPDTCDYYKSRYLDYVPQGMPDFDMKQPGWIDLNGKWSHDGPAALANCIWWFDSKFETAPVDPRPFWPGPGNPALNDNYPLLSSYDPALQWDDHDTNNVQPFINDLANNYLNTNPGGMGGTRDIDLVNGFRAYLNALGMAPDYRDTIVPVPSFEYIQGEVLVSQDVILLFGFYEEDAAGDWTNYLGSHWVTTAGVCTHDRIICISDPYLDALEGEPPAGSAHGPTVHNDADNISGPHSQIQHDPYTCVSMIPPGWTGPVEVVNYPTTAGIINQFNGMNASIDPGFWGGNPVHVLIQQAYVICPDTAIDTCDYYKSPYDDYAPYGMPDFDQKQNMWIYPASGAWSYCGPVALANCFWWFDSKFEPSPVDPRPFYPGPGNPAANDGYNLVYSFDPGGVWDDHDTNNVMPFVDSMALYCLTNSSGSGTNVFDLAQGAQDWIDSVGLSGKYTVNLFPVDPAFGFDQIRDEVLISQDVILLLGFWEDFGSGSCERIGGHFVTVAGTCTDPLDSALCISDPYFDMHEGEPPAGSAHGSSVHNDAANISGPHGTIHHDKYVVAPTTCNAVIPPFFTCELPGYPVNAGNVPVWYGQNRADTTIDPIPPQGGPIHTIIEYAVVICPDTTPPPTGACCEPPYGLCHIMTQFSCDSAGWDYKGDGTTCTPDPCDSCDYQTPGDVDNDGNINVADIAYLINFLYKGGPPPPVMANADPNGDCCIDYRDVLYLIQFVFFAGPAPVNCTCVMPPVCIPAPGTYVPGIVKHNTDGYLPTDGSPIGTNWHELFPGYCENWTCSSWVDNGDGILSYCDTLDFYHPVYGVKTLEHVELVTPTIELINTVDPFDTLYLDLIDPPNATCTTITEPIGTRWHEVYPQYCHQFMIVYHAGLNMGPLAVSDMIIIQSLNGADSGASYDTYMVTDIDCDIVTTPLITLGDEYDHNIDGYSPYDGTPVGTSWQELYPNFNDMWTVDQWIDNGDGWLSFCDTIRVVGQNSPYPVRWKHVKEVTFTLTCTDPANDTFYFDYRMLNPVYPWSSAPVGTFWHELYPTFSNMTWCINWIDNGTGFVDFCDSLDLEYLSGPDSGAVVRFHVESVDWDMVSTIEDRWDPPPPMDGKFKHNIDGWHPSDVNPEGSLWHELWFNYCEMWTCSLWIDNGNTVLDYCDTLVFVHEPTGRLSWEHIQVVTPTITITKGDSTWYFDGLDPNPVIDPVTAPVGGYWQLVYPRNSWSGLPYQITGWSDNGNGYLDSCDMIDFRDQFGTVHNNWHVEAFETDIITDPLPNPNIDEYDHNLDGYFPADGDPTGTYWHELYPNYCDLWQIEEWRDNGDDVLSFCDTLKFRGEIMEDSVLWKHVEEVTGTLVLMPEGGGDTTYMDMMCGHPTAEPLTMAEGPLGSIFHEVYPTFCRRYLWQGWGDNGNQTLDAGDQVAMRSILPPDSGTVFSYNVLDWQTDIMTTIIPEPSCCMPPIRGNVDMDPLDQIDISDLVYLVDYMFTGGPAPVCTEEADMNCSGGSTPIDIADLVYLVDYMFNQGPAPCRCDCSDCP